MSNNGLLATKNKGGDAYNCVIMGDKEIPKDKISKWKIKINTDLKNNYSNIYISELALINLKMNYIKNVGVFLAIGHLFARN